MVNIDSCCPVVTSAYFPVQLWATRRRTFRGNAGERFGVRPVIAMYLYQLPTVTASKQATTLN